MLRFCNWLQALYQQGCASECGLAERDLLFGLNNNDIGEADPESV
jgi:hypothetical protein